MILRKIHEPAAHKPGAPLPKIGHLLYPLDSYLNDVTQCRGAVEVAHVLAYEIPATQCDWAGDVFTTAHARASKGMLSTQTANNFLASHYQSITMSTPPLNSVAGGPPSAQRSIWNSAASTYHSLIGRTTLHGTTRLASVSHTLQPFTPTSWILDVAAGSGTLTFAVRAIAPPAARILATDISEAMLRLIDDQNVPGVATQAVDAVTLEGLHDNVFSHGMSSFALNHVADPEAALRNLVRVVAPGGLVAVAVWGARTENALLHADACRVLRPGYVLKTVFASGAWKDEDGHRDALESAGLREVRTESFMMPYECGGVDGAVEYWFRGMNPVPRKLIEEWEVDGGDVRALEREYRRLVGESYRERGGLFMEGVLGWGRKPE